MIPTANLAVLLDQTAARFPDRPAFIRGDLVVTWGAFAARARAAAGGLRTRGIAPGDRVLVHARNSIAQMETLWAAWHAGAVWVPTNFRLTPPEVAYLAESSGATAHIFDPAFPDHEAASRAANPALRLEIALGAEWDALTGPEAAPAEVGRDHPAWFFYTSGTTGRPKASVLTHGQLGFVVNNHLADLIPGTTERDVSLVVAPLSHGAGIHALVQVPRGAATVLMAGERFDPAEAWALVERHRISNMFTVPTILTMLARDPAVDRVDHSSLRYVIYAGAPMYRADQAFALGKLGKVLVQYYGMGEVTGAITVLPPEWHSTDDAKMPVGSCGFPRTGMEVAILSDAGARLAPGETGEICVRGGAVHAGYWNNPEADAKAFAGGWFHTGDLGHIDARGLVYITGRASDMYISGGSNVYPREIEEALLLHPAIAEACVVGMPHPKWGEAGVAVLVARDAVAEAALLAHLEGRLARYKWPARFVFWEALPKSGYGKVTKREVRAKLEAQE
ncbi:MAG: AMP-binding protein [Rhodospirillales bacterium]|nr:AMP-binding protein [Rhodospirillales bacterium]